jgi:hypothetical protein
VLGGWGSPRASARRGITARASFTRPNRGRPCDVLKLLRFWLNRSTVISTPPARRCSGIWIVVPKLWTPLARALRLRFGTRRRSLLYLQWLEEVMNSGLHFKIALCALVAFAVVLAIWLALR